MGNVLSYVAHPLQPNTCKIQIIQGGSLIFSLHSTKIRSTDIWPGQLNSKDLVCQLAVLSLLTRNLKNILTIIIFLKNNLTILCLNHVLTSKLEMSMDLRLPGYLFPLFHQIDNWVWVWVQVHISGLNDKEANIQVQLGRDQITEINIII